MLGGDHTSQSVISAWMPSGRQTLDTCSQQNKSWWMESIWRAYGKGGGNWHTSRALPDGL